MEGADLEATARQSLLKQLVELQDNVRENGGRVHVVKESPEKMHVSSLYPGLEPVSRIVCRRDKGEGRAGETCVVGGWVKSGRVQGKGAFAFIALNDGSTPKSIQVILNRDPKAGDAADTAVVDESGASGDATKTSTSSTTSSVTDLKPLALTGTCLVVSGTLKESPSGHSTEQCVELHVDVSAGGILFHGGCPGAEYPIAKVRHSVEYLREVMHLRPRTNLVSAIARVRDALAFATHDFFHRRGFLYVHTPIITASDCEGAGEMFTITKLLDHADDDHQHEGKGEGGGGGGGGGAVTKEDVEKIGAEVKALKASGKKKGDAELDAAVAKLLEAKAAASAPKIVGGLPRKPAVSAEGNTGSGGGGGEVVDYAHDFFSKRAYLTVSGQMNVETFCCALSRVYTFGPAFRAENSNTSRHLAEFWMIEPEIAFANLEDDMNIAEAYVKHCCTYVLEARMDDLRFFEKQIDKDALQRVRQVVAEPFARCSYTEAVDILKEAIAAGKKKFENEVFWGCDLASEHERYISEVVFKKPTIVFNYPKGIKAFYMRVNDDKETVAAMDILVPRVGELVGGSVREERLDVLEKSIVDNGLDPSDYTWYADLRRFGTVPHAGFGLGFERLIMFVTGVENIRDVIPFPRWPGNAAF